MRIAYILTSLGIGGAERQVVALAERMAPLGHEAVLVVLRSPQQHEWPVKVEVFRLNMTKSPSGVLRGLLRASGFLRSFKPDILHSHTFPANMAARVLRLMGATPRVLSTIHNIYEGDWKRTLAYHLTDPLSCHTTMVSKAVADRYVEIGAVPLRKCSVLTNGIDIEAFAPARARRPAEHGSGRDPAKFVWLAAGRAVPAKDFDNLLAAFSLVHKDAPWTQLWIAGDSSLRGIRIDGAMTDLENNGTRAVRRLGLCRDMALMLAGVDGFVLSSAWEGMPLVVGEAMAMEKPVVATDVGGVRELVGNAGVIVPAKDSATLAKAMLEVVRKRESARREMGRLARARICRHFDMNSKADEWERFYAQLIRPRSIEDLDIAHGRLMSEFSDKG